MLVKWLLQDPPPTERHAEFLASVTAQNAVLVSNISLWEIATLHSLKRIELNVPIRDFLERAVAPPLVRRIEITPAISAEVAALPDSFHRDPGDRIIVATARVLGATLLTQDKKIIEAGLATTL